MVIRVLFALVLALAALSFACGDDDDDVDEATGQPTEEATQATETTADEPTATEADEPAATDDGGGEGTQAETIAITTENFAFSAGSIEVPAGATIDVTLTNSDPVPHTFTIDGVVDVQTRPDEQASGSFEAPSESVEFYCKVHPDQMRGMLTVGGDAAGAGETGSDEDLKPGSIY